MFKLILDKDTYKQFIAVIEMLKECHPIYRFTFKFLDNQNDQGNHDNPNDISLSCNNDDKKILYCNIIPQNNKNQSKYSNNLGVKIKLPYEYCYFDSTNECYELILDVNRFYDNVQRAKLFSPLFNLTNNTTLHHNKISIRIEQDKIDINFI
jgi:hypothetical protein